MEFDVWFSAKFLAERLGEKERMGKKNRNKYINKGFSTLIPNWCCLNSKLSESILMARSHHLRNLMKLSPREQ